MFNTIFPQYFYKKWVFRQKTDVRFLQSQDPQETISNGTG
jgi:hypothetical protein